MSCISEAAGALWALSFDQDNRKKMVDDRKLRVIQRLSDLKDSENAKIKTAATGALWNLREDLTKSDDSAYQELGKESHINIKHGWPCVATQWYIHDYSDKVPRHGTSNYLKPKYFIFSYTHLLE